LKYDVAVLGGGPGGYEAAIRCAQYGLKTALIEAKELGGTCLNRGCIPTKALLHSSEIFRDNLKCILNNNTPYEDFGVDFTGVTYDYKRMASRKNIIVDRLRRGIASLEKAHGVTVIKGYGVLKDANTIAVSDASVSADKIILATGSAPSRPPIPGIDGKNVVTSDEVLAFTECPKNLVIIGGGVIGIEFATLFANLGKRVTVLEMMPSILPGVDKEILSIILPILTQKGVEVVTGAKVTSIRGGDTVAVDYEQGGAAKQASGACCVVSVGRTPQTKGIGLEAAGVRMDGGFVAIDNHMRTSVPNIYAIGDITGKIQLAHVATAGGMVAAANCAGKNKTMDYSIVPACIYTSPEIAYVGLTAEKAGNNTVTGTFNLVGNGKAMVMGENVGMVKLVSDKKTGEILGAQIIAPRATDMVAEIAAVMRCEGTIEELSDTIHPHPTVSEAIMEAAHDAEGLCCNAAPKK